jgi:hypothetical protein
MNKPDIQKRIKLLKRRALGQRVERCKPPPLDPKSIELHLEQYNNLKASLLGMNSANSMAITGRRIAGLGALGGVGKTWLALRLVHDPEVLRAFPDGILWKTFGEDKSAENQLKDLWYDLGGSDQGEFDVNNALQMFESTLENLDPSVLLVLDDVWHSNHLELFSKLILSRKNMKLLVTTRITEKFNEVFGANNCEVFPLKSSLDPDEAMKLMSEYANSEGGVHYDKESMLKIAARFGFHPKALSIISTQAPILESWSSLLVEIERYEMNSGGGKAQKIKTKVVEAKNPVYSAIDAVFEFKKEHDLKENLCLLGVFNEDKTFSVEDIAIALNSEVNDAKFVVSSLLKTSLLEQIRPKSSDSDSIFYLHDLVRDYARQNKKKGIETAFVQRMCEVVVNDFSSVTAYMFENLLDHLGRKKELLDYFTKRRKAAFLLKGALDKARTGNVEPEFRGNYYLMAIAFRVNPSIFDEVEENLRSRLLTDPLYYSKVFSPEIDMIK